MERPLRLNTIIGAYPSLGGRGGGGWVQIRTIIGSLSTDIFLPRTATEN